MRACVRACVCACVSCVGCVPGCVCKWAYVYLKSVVAVVNVSVGLSSKVAER